MGKQLSINVHSISKFPLHYRNYLFFSLLKALGSSLNKPIFGSPAFDCDVEPQLAAEDALI